MDQDLVALPMALGFLYTEEGDNSLERLSGCGSSALRNYRTLPTGFRYCSTEGRSSLPFVRIWLGSIKLVSME